MSRIARSTGTGRQIALLFLLGAVWLAVDSRAALAQRELPMDPDPFAKSYVSLEVARNYPTSFSQDIYKPGQYHPVIGYRHNLDGAWLMGVGGQFKIFQRRERAGEERPSRDLAILTISHEALRVLRLDHPTYLLFGPKLHYFLPSRGARLPLIREDNLQTEIGVAASMTLVRVLDSGALVTIRADRWRGTRTMDLHGIEVALGYSRPLR